MYNIEHCRGCSLGEKHHLRRRSEFMMRGIFGTVSNKGWWSGTSHYKLRHDCMEGYDNSIFEKDFFFHSCRSQQGVLSHQQLHRTSQCSPRKRRPSRKRRKLSNKFQQAPTDIQPPEGPSVPPGASEDLPRQRPNSVVER